MLAYLISILFSFVTRSSLKFSSRLILNLCKYIPHLYFFRQFLEMKCYCSLEVLYLLGSVCPIYITAGVILFVSKAEYLEYADCKCLEWVWWCFVGQSGQTRFFSVDSWSSLRQNCLFQRIPWSFKSRSQISFQWSVFFA